MASSAFHFVLVVDPYANEHHRPILMASPAVLLRWPRLADGWRVIANELMHDYEAPRLIVNRTQLEAIRARVPTAAEPS